MFYCFMYTNELTTKLQEVYTSIGSRTPEQARHYIHHIDDYTKPDSHDARLLGHHRECHLNEDASHLLEFFLVFQEDRIC